MKNYFWLTLLMSVLACSGQPNHKESNEVASIDSSSKNYKEAVCFVYHRFGDNRFPSTNIALKDFELHLQWLKQNNYLVVTLSEAIQNLQEESTERKMAVITIDDGYKSFYKNGLPLLKKYQFPATLFINTETIGSGDYMNWEELKEASHNGIEIGNHTHTHAYFLNFDENERYLRFKKDIEISQDHIEKNLLLKPQVFAYPYGEFDNKMKEIVRTSGFIGAAAQNSGVFNSLSDNFQIPRFPISESTTGQFEEKVRMQSLKVTKTNAAEFILPKGEKQPALQITIDTKGISINQIQCFAQGSKCTVKVLSSSENQTIIEVMSTTDISKNRRTLYTVTAPDSAGHWHWFSHLWINPAVH